MTDNSDYLHFTYWPVQDFIVQARRTRDLWVGSYLLSYLAGKVIDAVGANQIIFPDVADDPMLQAIGGRIPIDRSAPPDKRFQKAGSLPTCFMAKAGADPEQGRKSLQEAWKKVAKTVWQQIASCHPSQDIWDRQIESVWTCYWVRGTYHDLQQRKHWRTPTLAPEDGEKCSICGERQEISGKGMGTSGSRQAMRDWWTILASKINGRSGLHLQTDTNRKCTERLCAVCLTKRLLPLREVAQEAFGWRLPSNVPSVSYLAAVSWLKQCLEKVPKEAAAFAERARAAAISKSETRVRLWGISSDLKQSIKRLRDQLGVSTNRKDYRKWLQGMHTFVDLDGSVFFEDALLNNEFGLNEQDQKALLEHLRELYKVVKSRPSPFYAILFMDGDSTGELLDGCNDDERQAISCCIGAFSRKVPDLVAEQDGWLIYAGGEDVFALLPLENAIRCAVRLQRCFKEQFQTSSVLQRLINSITISAAINFVSIHTALSVAVRDTRELLEEYAKDRMGRDTLACRVWKRGGPILTWSLPWKKVFPPDAASLDHTLIDEVIDRFQNNKNGSDQFSSGFFYRLRDLFALLEPPGGTPMKHDAAVQLLTAEYLANRDLDWPNDMSEADKRQEARERVELLLNLCRETYRKTSRNERGEIDSENFDELPGHIRADGALLVRFLAQKGLGE